MASWGGGHGIPVGDQEAQQEAGKGGGHSCRQWIELQLGPGRSERGGEGGEGEEPESGLELSLNRNALLPAHSGGPSARPFGFHWNGVGTPRPAPPGPSRRRMRGAPRAGGDYFPRPARAPPLVLARRNAPR